MDSGASATSAAVTRRGVVVTVGGAVADVEGIARSRVKVSHRRIRVDATSSAAAGDTTRSSTEAVRRAAQEAIDGLKLSSSRRLRVNVSAHEKGRR